jgi:hypothetical protein
LEGKGGEKEVFMVDVKKTTVIVNLIFDEYQRASDLEPPFNSSHEGYAVIKEGLDELWCEIKKHKSLRSKQAMMAGAVQIGAMALRFVVDICMD